MKNTTSTLFNASEFCSRKLLELVERSTVDDPPVLSREERDAALVELTQRRHYLTELADRGLIGHPNRH